MFFPAPYREVFPGGGRADGQQLHAELTGFIRGFFDHYLKGQDNGYPDAFFEQFPEARSVDISYVKEWAQSR
jgi:hypothetical protein